jgi:hypothetical protein
MDKYFEHFLSYGFFLKSAHHPRWRRLDRPYNPPNTSRPLTLFTLLEIAVESRYIKMADEITDTNANNRYEPDLETGKVAPEKKEDDKPLDYILSIGGREVEKVAVLSFRALQLHRIAALQAQLVTKQCVVMSTRGGMDDDATDQLLQKYGE